MTDPTAQMGFQVGQHAVKAGTEYMEQNVLLFSLFQGSSLALALRLSYVLYHG